ncbi:peptidase family M13 [Dothidotthia symphoricarpi CBS 119687]|uniref:Peptidase family M13 n=1 Tax=Dothidotthia symphoricarpi CBS 119687 TaxID=1392245 RepID=A0A6A6AD70_9PLEO|nr:peptidase family M13 [Dothidotthia symphoricarpi CBS 119687]KAF2128691.1 peptidase family M13 [Dothidotthia symphoricarpi CBS 119687]
MSEKAPLVPRTYAPARAERSTRAPRCSSGRAALRMFGLAALTGLVYYGVPEVQKHVHKSKMCLTPACVHAASEILYNLSPNYKELDPCNNFEELVCGGWRDRHDLRSDQGDAFTGTIMNENSELLLRHILEAPFPTESEHSYFSPKQLGASKASDDEQNFNKMKAAYNACLDEDKIKSIGAKPLLVVLEEIKAAYPVESLGKADSGSTKEAVLLLAKYGVSALVATGTGADDRDPDTVVVSVAPPSSFGLPSKERYEDVKLVEKYRGVAVEVLSALYPDHDKDSFAKVIDLERKLAAASPSTEDSEDVTKYYNPMLIDEAAALTPEIELTALLHGLAPENFETKRVIVMAPEYMKALSLILAETEKDVLQSYFIWKTVQSFSSYIDADAVKPYRQFVNVLAGKDPDSAPERWRKCVSHVDDGLGWILSRFFVEKAFSAEAKEFGDTIITDIKTEFAKKLKSTEWMDKQTTKQAIDKVHNIIQKIGYPTKSPNIMDPPSLSKYYGSVNVSSDAFFYNALSMRGFAVNDEWSALGKPVDRDAWGMTVPTVNAYYNPPGNEIVFPAGIMQFPVFDVNVPAYMSYGAFGSVAGHELSHAFDSTGRHYDQNGNYTDWWSNSTVDAFKERAQCFVDQYANFSIPGSDEKPLHVNGRLTLGENIADAGGLSAAFQAWKRRAHEHPNKDLPGLEHFTQEQLFFVTYSNWWCGKSRKDTAINRIYTDPHAPKWARILGTMANSREFRESFECKAKEPTCQIW